MSEEYLSSRGEPRKKVYYTNSDISTDAGVVESFKQLTVGPIGDCQHYRPTSAVVTKQDDDEMLIVVRYKKRA